MAATKKDMPPLPEMAEVVQAQKERVKRLLKDQEDVYDILNSIDMNKLKSFSPALYSKIDKALTILIPF